MKLRDTNEDVPARVIGVAGLLPFTDTNEAVESGDVVNVVEPADELLSLIDRSEAVESDATAVVMGPVR